ncbi:MAG: formylglycine-generating enzyme family protein [Planctomycetaceae bacterium]|nr:formylglycine-generating enzyme family protein [Planctomycetaceae bacterium]
MRYWLCTVLLLAATLANGAEPIPDATQQLLKTFHAEFVAITPGEGQYPASFTYGHGDDAREVTLQQSFAIARYEVPQNLYEAVMGKNPSRWKGARNSVEMITHAEAEEFCAHATRLLRELQLITDEQRIVLPTEEQWEYCCRAGTSTRYSFGDAAQAPDDVAPKATLLDPYAWHTGNAAGNDPPVGALKPNAWGLYDMHGYLWEFCSASGQGSDAIDDSAPTAPQRVIIRGGSWKDQYPLLESSSRKSVPETLRDDAVGFRCVLGG